MMCSQFFSRIFFITFFFACSSQESPKVLTPLGPVSGYLKESFNGRRFSAFEGIPYAKPPIGSLRFADPVPVEPWTEVLNGTITHTCIQLSITNIFATEGDEDCLYLNVYVPREVPDAKEKLEVIVYVHGGAFSAGSGHQYAYPDYLMDREFILVSLNYRLGILGFLSTGDSAASGNFGLKDQSMALKWVQQNIASFGGNPDSVTLTGLSAGAASVHLHYFSPMSKGLFHRGISHSGSALDFWSVQKEPLEKTKQLAVLTGCPVDDTEKIVECLREQPADSLTLNLYNFLTFYTWLFIPFIPVIENSTNAFLSESPFELVEQKKVLDVPWITSTMQEEGLFFALEIEPFLSILNEQWTELAQIIFFYNHTLPEDSWTSVAEKIRENYFDEGEDISTETIHKFAKIATDRFFLTGVESSARYQAAAVKSPVYYYNFNYQGTYSFTQYLTKNNSVLGTVHGDDTLYIYTPNFLKSTLPPSEEDVQIKDLFLDMMVEYAKTGVPKFGNAKWAPIANNTFTYINITSSEDVVTQTVEEMGDRKFWQELGLIDNYN